MFGNYWGNSYVQFLLTVSDQFYDRRKQQHFSSWRWCSSVLDWTSAQKIFHKICLGQCIWYVPILWSIFQLSFPCAHLYTFWMTTLLHSSSCVWYYYTALYVLFESVFLCLPAAKIWWYYIGQICFFKVMLWKRFFKSFVWGLSSAFIKQ